MIEDPVQWVVGDVEVCTLRAWIWTESGSYSWSNRRGRNMGRSPDPRLNPLSPEHGI
jgi:hypothetical protein